jgi:hypothetical protein
MATAPAKTTSGRLGELGEATSEATLPSVADALRAIRSPCLIYRRGGSIFPVKHEVPGMKTKSIMIWMLLLMAVAAVSGCATHALWTESELGTWHEPAANTPLQLFRDRQSREVLVLYDESCSRHHEIRARAYLLYRNEGRIERQEHPAFVKTDLARHLEPVPIFFDDAAAAGAPPSPVYAVLSTNQFCFTLYSSGAEVGFYTLPFYYDGMGKMERLALTPLAATADLTIVGGAVFYLIGASDPEAAANALNSIKIR